MQASIKQVVHKLDPTATLPQNFIPDVLEGNEAAELSEHDVDEDNENESSDEHSSEKEDSSSDAI